MKSATRKVEGFDASATQLFQSVQHCVRVGGVRVQAGCMKDDLDVCARKGKGKEHT